MKSILKNNSLECILGILAVLAGSFMAYKINRMGLTTTLTDQFAHLNFSRLIFDSFTPGISQLGFWPPLLHIVMIPFVAIPPLYESGLAGYFALLPFFIAGAVFLYKLGVLLTENRTLSFAGALMFISHPYILYYAVTPMAEILFLSNLIISTYYIVLWMESRRDLHLLLSAIFITLATLSRFEGIILIPIGLGVILTNLILQGKKRDEIEAIILIFSTLAIVGLGFILIYSFVFSGNPLTFIRGGWWLRSPVEGSKPAQGDIGLTAQYALYASFYVIGKALVLLALISAVIAFALKNPKKIQITAACILLASPLFFVSFSLFTGGVPMGIPDLPPINGFLNERYMLTWIGFVILAPILAISGAINDYKKLKKIKILQYSIGVMLVSLTFIQFHNVIAGDFQTIRKNIGVASSGQLQIAEVLNREYDYGKVLAIRVNNDPVLVKAGLPLRVYVHEANYLYYEQVFSQPWFFARWVLMFNPDDETDKWARLKEPVSVKWESSDVFHKYYELVAKNNKKKLYKVRDETIKKLALEQKYNADHIPSINKDMESWNLKTIYVEMNVK